MNDLVEVLYSIIRSISIHFYNVWITRREGQGGKRGGREGKEGKEGWKEGIREGSEGRSNCPPPSSDSGCDTPALLRSAIWRVSESLLLLKLFTPILTVLARGPLGRVEVL